jgi:hypothetical protein
VTRFYALGTAIIIACIAFGFIGDVARGAFETRPHRR